MQLKISAELARQIETQILKNKACIKDAQSIIVLTDKILKK